MPLISTPALEALKTALETNDRRLVQGTTTVPPPLQRVQDWPAEAACILGYCGVIESGGFGTATVAKTEEKFAKWCYDIDMALGEPAGCHWFLNWADEAPRDEVRRQLIPEIALELARRKESECPVTPATTR